MEKREVAQYFKNIFGQVSFEENRKLYYRSKLYSQQICELKAKFLNSFVGSTPLFYEFQTHFNQYLQKKIEIDHEKLNHIYNKLVSNNFAQNNTPDPEIKYPTLKSDNSLNSSEILVSWDVNQFSLHSNINSVNHPTRINNAKLVSLSDLEVGQNNSEIRNGLTQNSYNFLSTKSFSTSPKTKHFHTLNNKKRKTFHYPENYLHTNNVNYNSSFSDKKNLNSPDQSSNSPNYPAQQSIPKYNSPLSNGQTHDDGQIERKHKSSSITIVKQDPFVKNVKWSHLNNVIIRGQPGFFDLRHKQTRLRVKNLDSGFVAKENIASSCNDNDNHTNLAIKFELKKMIGEGAFAKVFQTHSILTTNTNTNEGYDARCNSIFMYPLTDNIEAQQQNENGCPTTNTLNAKKQFLHTNMISALKIQQDPFDSVWEYHIYNRIRQKMFADETTTTTTTIRENKKSAVFHPKIFGAFIYADVSFLHMELFANGTLLNFVNYYKSRNKLIPTPIIIYLACEMLDILYCLHHICHILHTDIKPDNFLLGDLSVMYELCHLFSSTTSKKSVSYCDLLRFVRQHRMLKIMDFGKSIDLTFYPKDVHFAKRSQEKDFSCPEMRERKAWSFSLDYFGFLGCVHCLTFNSYMQIHHHRNNINNNNRLQKNCHSNSNVLESDKAKAQTIKCHHHPLTINKNQHGGGKENNRLQKNCHSNSNVLESEKARTIIKCHHHPLAINKNQHGGGKDNRNVTMRWKITEKWSKCGRETAQTFKPLFTALLNLCCNSTEVSDLNNIINTAKGEFFVIEADRHKEPYTREWYADINIHWLLKLLEMLGKYTGPQITQALSQYPLSIV